MLIHFTKSYNLTKDMRIVNRHFDKKTPLNFRY